MKALVLLLAMLAASCAATKPPPHTAPHATASTKGDSSEAALGALVEELLLEPLGSYESPKLARYVESVGDRVARCSTKTPKKWHISIADDPSIEAHALPGARIRVTRGLLALLSSEAELAAVLAHEIVHVEEGHTREAWRPDFPPIGSSDRQARFLERRRDEERQADSIGTELLACAGYSPAAMERAIAALERAEPSDDDDRDDPHPPPRARLARLVLSAGGRSGEWGRDRYLSQIEALPYGDSDSIPRLAGNRYVAPGDLTFDLPSRYAVSVQNTLLVTTSGEPSLTILRLGGRLWPRMIKSALVGSPHTVQTLSDHRVFSGSLDPEGTAVSLALVESKHHTFVIAVSGGNAESRAVLDHVVESARAAPLAAHPTRAIAIRRARKTTSFAAFLRGACPATPLELGSLLNGVDGRSHVPAGTPLKCVGR